MPLRFCLEQNSNRLPFGVAQVGRSFRNEIAPRAGLTRQREFTQAEIEYFVNPKQKAGSSKPGDMIWFLLKRIKEWTNLLKLSIVNVGAHIAQSGRNGSSLSHLSLEPTVPDEDHPKFASVESTVLILVHADAQLNAKDTVKMAVGEAVRSGLINNETLGYFIVKTWQFLVSIGLKKDPCVNVVSDTWTSRKTGQKHVNTKNHLWLCWKTQYCHVSSIFSLQTSLFLNSGDFDTTARYT